MRIVDLPSLFDIESFNLKDKNIYYMGSPKEPGGNFIS